MAVATRFLCTGACTLFLPAALTLPAAAVAQDSPRSGPVETVAPSEPVAEDIVVTAQRREQSLQDVPVAVTVVGGDTLRETQVTGLNDLGNRVAGVKINNAGASDSLNIRGIGSGVNMGFEQAVATFVDGVYLSRSQISRGGFLDLERIEILKGPQSTFFGSNAIAGALSVTTRKPSQTFDGYASALYSPTDGEFDLQLASGGPVTDRLSARFAVRYSGMDEGYITNFRFDDKGPKNKDIQSRAALRYQVPDLVEVNLRLDYASYDDEHSELQETVNCPPGPGYGSPSATCAALIAEGKHDNKLDYVTSTGDSSFRLVNYNGALTAAFDVVEHTLTTITGYYKHDIFRTTVGGAVLAAPGLRRLSGLPLSQPEDFRSFSQELRLESGSGGFLEYTLGLYYDDTKLRGAINTGFYFSDFAARVAPPGLIPAGTPIAQEVSAIQDQTNRSAFAAATLNITDALRVNLGARYSSIKKEAHRGTRAGLGDDIGQVVQDFTPAQFAAWTRPGSFGRLAGDFPITERTDDRFMPSVNVQVDLSPAVMAYASYSTGFKAGGWSIGQNLDVFEPETVKAYEAGLKAAWFGNRLTTNLTIFNSDYDNLQEATSVIDPNTGIYQSIIGNVAKARSRGVEIEVGVRPVGGFSLSANASYLDAEYRTYPNAPCTLLQLLTPVPPGTQCVQDLGGRPKAYAPKWSGSVNASYEAELSSSLKVELGGWLYFTSGYYQQASIDPLLYQSGYAKLDLRAAVGAPDARWKVAVIAKNVTDRITGNYRAAMLGSNAVSVRVDRPRSIALQLSTRF